jgi:hypothetical protein
LTRQDKSFSVQPIASKAALCKTPVCICLRQPNCGHIRSKRRSQTAVTVVLPGGGGARLWQSPAAALTLFPSPCVPATCCGWALPQPRSVDISTFLYQGQCQDAPGKPPRRLKRGFFDMVAYCFFATQS